MAAPARELQPDRAMAPACGSTPAPLWTQDEKEAGVLTLLRIRDRMRWQLMEYSAAVYCSQENFLDHVSEEKFLQSAAQDLRIDTEEVKVSFQNKTLALQRAQITNALRNKVNEDDKDSRLILETMKHIIMLSRTIIECQQQAHQKEQQLIDIKRKRLSLKKHEEQKLEQIHTVMKELKEKQASVNVTERKKMLDILEQERAMTTIIQNVFQSIIIGSRVNWVEDPSLKEIVLQLENNLYLQ